MTTAAGSERKPGAPKRLVDAAEREAIRSDLGRTRPGLDATASTRLRSRSSSTPIATRGSVAMRVSLDFPTAS